MFDATEWKIICTEIQKDFGEKLTKQELLEIITNGWKGVYDNTQYAINGFTIYKWINAYLKSRPKKEIPCPKGIENFYWIQMSDREKMEYLNKIQKTTKINKN